MPGFLGLRQHPRPLAYQKSRVGVMKKPGRKRQPTRDDLASALRTIRDQSQIIGLQAKTISRQQCLPQSKKKYDKKPPKPNGNGHTSTDPYVN